MRSWPMTGARCALWTLLLTVGVMFVVASDTRSARAQLQFTEVMSEPGGDDNLWEWVEVRNTSSAALNLDGWVFDDEALVALRVGI